MNKKFLDKKINYNWAHDPFLRTPGFFKGKKIEYKFKLDGLIYDKENSMAIINGNTVYVNSFLEGGFRVTDIGPNYVIIDNGEKAKELQLPYVVNKVETEIFESDVQSDGHNRVDVKDDKEASDLKVRDTASEKKEDM